MSNAPIFLRTFFNDLHSTKTPKLHSAKTLVLHSNNLLLCSYELCQYLSYTYLIKMHFLFKDLLIMVYMLTIYVHRTSHIAAHRVGKPLWLCTKQAYVYTFLLMSPP